MKPREAMKESYAEVAVFNIPMAFTPSRILDSSVPKGYYRYSVRHDDEQQGIPCEIAKKVICNHWGDIITFRKLELTKNGYLEINEKDWVDVGDCYEPLTIFMNKYPV